MRSPLAIRLAGVAALWLLALLFSKRCPFPLNMILWALPVLGAVGVFQWWQEEEEATGPKDARAWTSASSRQICPHCFTPLGKEAVASPNGEARCGYCGCWFNVHAARMDLGETGTDGPPVARRTDCPHCAEAIQPAAAVSPHGDTKCPRCRVWFNVFGRRMEDRSAGEPDLRCPHCAAPVQSRIEVSPSGDARCAYCGAWFNVLAGRKA